MKPLSYNKFSILDIFEFAEEIRAKGINVDDILVSYDVVSLFTNVPLDETIGILVNKAFKDNWFNSQYNLNISRQDLADLLNIATKDQLFQFEGTLYEQFDGVAMGSPLGPLIANVFMCSIEEQLDLNGKMPEFYRRYVDDTLTIMPSVNAASNFLQVLNASPISILHNGSRKRLCCPLLASNFLINQHQLTRKCLSSQQIKGYFCIMTATLMPVINIV